MIEKKNNRIKIAFYTDGVHDKTLSPMVMLFYYKEKCDYLYYKELVFNVEDLRSQGSQSAIDHLEKNYDSCEKVLFYNHYKASKEDVERIFEFLIVSSDIGIQQDKDTSEFIEKKNELLNNIRRNKIKNLLSGD